MVSAVAFWLTLILVSIALGVLGFFVGYYVKKTIIDRIHGDIKQMTEDAEAKAKSVVEKANDEAKKIRISSEQEATNIRKQMVLEGKEEIHRERERQEKELEERRKEVSKLEDRIAKKEETIDKKLVDLEKKEDLVKQKDQKAETRLKDADEVVKAQEKKLEEISKLTKEEASKIILDELDQKLAHEKAQKILDSEQEYQDTAERKAREIISMAIQRCAAETTSETTVSVVELPNDDMKGRIIGREGRNIRAIEAVTGVDLVIDDTPEAITLSCFDPVRREIARVALVKLIADGRIHPAKIEEVVEKSKEEIETIIKQKGEEAVLDVNVTGLHPELIKVLGRLHYRTSYGQNVLRHSIETAYICGLLAQSLGMDQKRARRAGLLHDIGKALDHETEGTHVQIGVDLCRKYKEKEDIIHAVEAHHGDVEMSTPLAFIVAAADAISASRPGARRDSIENYIKRLEKLEEVVTSFDGVERCFAVQAGREVRIMVEPDKIDDDHMVILARDICNKIQDEVVYSGQVKVNMVRESRIIDYAK